MRKFWGSKGFTRLEALLITGLAVSIVFTARALLPLVHSKPSEPPAPDNGLLEGTDLLLAMIGPAGEAPDDPKDAVQPAKKKSGKMPVPADAAAAQKKQATNNSPDKAAGKTSLSPGKSGQPQSAAKTNAAPVKAAARTQTSKPSRDGSKLHLNTEQMDIPPEIREMLAELENAEWSREVEIKLLGIVRRWARSDIEAASEFALLIERRGTRNAALSSNLNIWLTESPQDALAWFEKAASDNPFLIGDLTQQFFSKLSTKNVLTALDGVWEMPTLGLKRAALQAVSQRLIYLGHEQDVLSIYGAVDSDDEKKMVIDVVMQSMARYKPEELGEWVFSLPDADHQARALNAFVSAWSRDYPRAAAEWVVAEVPADAGRSRQLETVSRAWAAEDPVEAAEWLLGMLPPSTEIDGAVDAFARSVLAQYPDNAAAWSFAVTDNAQRWRLMEAVARSWMNTSPAAARLYLEQTDLPASTKARLTGLLQQ